MCPCVLGPQRAGDLRTVVAVAFRSLLRMCSGSSGAYNLTVRSSRRRFMASCYLSASGCCRFGCTSLRRGLTQVLGLLYEVISKPTIHHHARCNRSRSLLLLDIDPLGHRQRPTKIHNELRNSCVSRCYIFWPCVRHLRRKSRRSVAMHSIFRAVASGLPIRLANLRFFCCKDQWNSSGIAVELSVSSAALKTN